MGEVEPEDVDATEEEPLLELLKSPKDYYVLRSPKRITTNNPYIALNKENKKTNNPYIALNKEE